MKKISAKISKIKWVSSNKNEQDSTKKHPITCISIQPSFKRFATGSQTGEIKIWSAKNLLKKTSEIKNDNNILCLIKDTKGVNSVNCVAFSTYNKEGMFLVSASDELVINVYAINYGNQSISVKNIENWSIYVTFQAHEMDVTHACFGVKDNLIATGSVDNSVKVWDFTSYNEAYQTNFYQKSNSFYRKVDSSALATFKKHKSWVKCVQFDPLGEYLASYGDDKAVIIYNVINKSKIKIEAIIKKPFKHSEKSTFKRTLSWSPEGKYLVISNCFDKPKHVAFVIQRKKWFDHDDSLRLVGHSRNVSTVAFSPAVYLSATSQYSTLCALICDDRTLSLWNPPQSKPILVLQNITPTPIFDVTWSYDGYFLLICCHDGSVYCLDFSFFKTHDLVGKGINLAHERDKYLKYLNKVYDRSFETLFAQETQQMRYLNDSIKSEKEENEAFRKEHELNIVQDKEHQKVIDLVNQTIASKKVKEKKELKTKPVQPSVHRIGNKLKKLEEKRITQTQENVNVLQVKKKPKTTETVSNISIGALNKSSVSKLKVKPSTSEVNILPVKRKKQIETITKNGKKRITPILLTAPQSSSHSTKSSSNLNNDDETLTNNNTTTNLLELLKKEKDLLNLMKKLSNSNSFLKSQNIFKTKELPNSFIKDLKTKYMIKVNSEIYTSNDKVENLNHTDKILNLTLNLKLLSQYKIINEISVYSKDSSSSSSSFKNNDNLIFEVILFGKLKLIASNSKYIAFVLENNDIYLISALTGQLLCPVMNIYSNVVSLIFTSSSKKQRYLNNSKMDYMMILNSFGEIYVYNLIKQVCVLHKVPLDPLLKHINELMLSYIKKDIKYSIRPLEANNMSEGIDFLNNLQEITTESDSISKSSLSSLKEVSLDETFYENLNNETEEEPTSSSEYKKDIIIDLKRRFTIKLLLMENNLPLLQVIKRYTSSSSSSSSTSKSKKRKQTKLSSSNYENSFYVYSSKMKTWYEVSNLSNIIFHNLNNPLKLAKFTSNVLLSEENKLDKLKDIIMKSSKFYKFYNTIELSKILYQPSLLLDTYKLTSKQNKKKDDDDDKEKKIENNGKDGLILDENIINYHIRNSIYSSYLLSSSKEYNNYIIKYTKRLLNGDNDYKLREFIQSLLKGKLKKTNIIKDESSLDIDTNLLDNILGVEYKTELINEQRLSSSKREAEKEEKNKDIEENKNEFLRADLFINENQIVKENIMPLIAESKKFPELLKDLVKFFKLDHAV